MLGEFRCEEILGEGGMGQVWRATHRSSSQTVAIKVIHDRRSQTGSARRAFHREINAIASLNHRGIVRILDAGEVTDDQMFQAGSPWFAMQLARAGSFGLEWVQSFSDLARLLFDLLDALAYAHARGIIHRDLKPDNILLEGGDEHGYRPVLTDFGIAFTVESEMTARAVAEPDSEDRAGTPSYMAPEQFHGEWRQFGPWTDLYALGCVAWEITCGFAPFEGDSVVNVALQHLEDPLPRLAPRFSVPDGFESWLRRATQKAPHERFQCAADAAWSLYVLLSDNPQWQAASALRAPEDFAREATLETLTLSDQTLQLSAAQLARTLRRDQSEHEVLPTLHPPIPGVMSESGKASREPLAGVGLGLFGVRELPLVDRDEEREVLWNALKSCPEALNVTLLEGPPGVGKSKLVNWIATRAEEVGAAHTFIVRHNAAHSGAHGLGQAIRAALRASKLQGVELERHLRVALRHLTDDDSTCAETAYELASLLSNIPLENRPIRCFESPAERHELVASLMDLRSRLKPLIVVVENAHVAADTLDFVLHLARKHPTLPLAVYVCFDPSRLGAVEAERIKDLRSVQSVSSLEICGLANVYHEELVRSILPMDDVSASRIATGSKGCPDEMIQMISDLIARGEIVPGEHGYTLHQNSRLTGIFEDVWHRAIGRLEDDPRSHPDIVVSLEIASALGDEVLKEEWSKVCKNFGVGPAADDLELAVEHGLVERIEAGFKLVSPQLANRLRELSIESGRWRKIHAVCATLSFSSGAGSSVHERRALHYEEAGDHLKAREHLRLAIEDLLGTSDYARAAELARKLDDDLARDGIPRDDARRIIAMTHRVDATRFRGRLTEAIEAKKAFEARVATCNDAHARANAFRAFGNLDYLISNFGEATRWYERAFETCPEDGHLLKAKLYHGKAWFLSNSNSMKNALAPYERAIVEAKAAGAVAEEGWAWYGIADARYRLQDLEGLGAAKRAHELFVEAGSRTGLASARTALGDFARLAGNLSEALHHYESAIETLVRVGSILESMARIRLAMGLFEAGDNDGALKQSYRALDRLDGAMQLPLKAIPHYVVALLEEDADIALDHCKQGAAIADMSGYIHPDLDMLRERLAARGRFSDV